MKVNIFFLVAIAAGMFFSCTVLDDGPKRKGSYVYYTGNWCVNYDYKMCTNKADLVTDAQSCANASSVLQSSCPIGFNKEDYSNTYDDDPYYDTGYCLLYNECYADYSQYECEYSYGGSYYSTMSSCQNNISGGGYTGYCLLYNECNFGYLQSECEYSYGGSYYSNLSSCQNNISGGGYTGYCLLYNECYSYYSQLECEYSYGGSYYSSLSSCQNNISGGGYTGYCLLYNECSSYYSQYECEYYGGSYYSTMSSCQDNIKTNTGTWCVNHDYEDCNDQYACTSSLSACRSGWGYGTPSNALELMSSCPNGYEKYSSLCEN